MLIKDEATFSELRNSGVDGVLMDGTQKSRKGVIVGGYYEVKVIRFVGRSESFSVRFI
jgi:hypothetical protein